MFINFYLRKISEILPIRRCKIQNMWVTHDLLFIILIKYIRIFDYHDSRQPTLIRVHIHNFYPIMNNIGYGPNIKSNVSEIFS